LWSSAQRFVIDGRFDPRHVALLRVEADSPLEKTRELYHAVLHRLESLPGVVAVSLWNRGGVLDGP